MEQGVVILLVGIAATAVAGLGLATARLLAGGATESAAPPTRRDHGVSTVGRRPPSSSPAQPRTERHCTRSGSAVLRSAFGAPLDGRLLRPRQSVTPSTIIRLRAASDSLMLGEEGTGTKAGHAVCGSTNEQN